jgi:hypothetical protein
MGGMAVAFALSVILGTPKTVPFERLKNPAKIKY